MHKDIIKTKGKDAQEDMITEERTTILQKLMHQALENYQKHNNGNLP